MKRCQTRSKHSTTDRVGSPYLWVPYQWIQPTTDRKYSDKCYIVDDLYYVVGPMTIASVLYMYRLFVCVCVLIPSTMQYNNYSDSIYIVLSIISHLEVI